MTPVSHSEISPHARGQLTSEEIALENCGNEQIQFINQIQSFGCLIGIGVGSMRVEHVSRNALLLTGRQITLGESISDCFDNRTLVHDMRGAMGLPNIETQRDRLGCYKLAGGDCEIALHRSGDIWVVEIEREYESGSQSDGSLDQVRSMLSSMTSMSDQKPLLQSAVEIIRRVTGYDRVVGYQFVDDGDGEVRAEVHRPGLDPYLGLRFPASDIPSQVRKAMLRMPFRCIADVNSSAVAIDNSQGLKPLDLSMTHLRAVSPMHIEYLKNMGVRSTVNLPIVTGGELWGMFALHHYRPFLISPRLRSICELFSRFFSLEIQQNIHQETISLRQRFLKVQRSIDRLATEDRPNKGSKPSPADEDDDFAASTSFADQVESIGDELCQFMDADGMMFRDQNAVCQVGVTPTLGRMSPVVQQCVDNVTSFNSIQWDRLDRAVDERDGTSIAGVLLIMINGETPTWIAFFRRPEIEKIRWAGNPEKRIEFGPDGPRLHPRASFEEYADSVRCISRHWSEAQLAMASEMRISLVEAFLRRSRILQNRWRRDKETQRIVIAELNHRVKNVLAMVRSIAAQSRKSSNSLDHFTKTFEARIDAMAVANDLISRGDLQWAPIWSLIETELQPFIGTEKVVQISGPQWAIKGELAAIFSLVIHEMVTNAVKYGPLGDASGKLTVSWTAQNGAIEIAWKETIDRQVDKGKVGFGLAFIQRAIPHEFGGETSVKFAEKGVQIKIVLPSNCVCQLPHDTVEISTRELSSPVDSDQAVCGDQTATTQVQRLANILVLEDSFLISIETERLLSSMGVATVHSASNCHLAMEWIQSESVEFALLDINLGDQKSFGVADELLTRGIGFIFTTGYGEELDFPKRFADVPRVKKPLDARTIAAAIATVRQTIKSES